MNLSIFSLFKCLLRWKVRILAAVIAAVLLAGMYADSIQTYTSQTIIKFNDASVAGGTFPDGTAFNVYDLASPKVIQRALDNLKINRTVDNVRAKITITPIIPDSITEIKKANEKDGEDYEYYPTTFSVVYRGSANQPAGQVRNLLDEVVLEYIKYYAEKYASYAVADNMVADEDIFNYDYVERADIMSENLTDIMSALEGYNKYDSSFRSAVTGKSFTDIYYEYNHLKTFTMSRLYANIYQGKIAISRDRVVERYLEKEHQNILASQNYTDMAEMTRKQMDAFSSANKSVPNAYGYSREDTNNDDIVIIDDIHRSNEDNYIKVKTTYDNLAEDYASQLVAANNKKLDAEHCAKVAEIFSGDVPNEVDTEELEKEVAETIKTTIAKMNELYDTTIRTIDDYNDKSASKNITLLTGVRCYENVSKSLYSLVALILSGGFMLVVAVMAEFISEYKKKAKEEEEDEESDEESTEENIEECVKA